jgi:hypothetical protein
MSADERHGPRRSAATATSPDVYGGWQLADVGEAEQVCPGDPQPEVGTVLIRPRMTLVLLY